MATWPTQSDYKDALQNPDTAFRDPDLKQSQAERSPMGVPRARSGAFASVYKMTGPKGVVALKLFNFPNEDRARRYKAVSDYLEKELGTSKPPALVKFQYHLEGIRVNKGWYPTLTMSWVKGVSLGEWVRLAMERKQPDLLALRKMSESWAALVQQLQDRKIAHGDLQHDNIMVVGDALVLVDYDGMCVPALDPPDPRKKLEQLEFGKPAYQHPGRVDQLLGGNLDHFSAWIILIALRATAADPRLYVRHVLQTNNENLLFSPHDIIHPERSILWPELFRISDPEVSGWARMLHDSLKKTFDKIPLFSLDPFTRLRELVTAASRDWPQIEAETKRLAQAGNPLPPELADKADPISRLKKLCNASRKDWQAIFHEGDQLAKSGMTFSPQLKSTVEIARRRVAACDALKAAVQARDPRIIATAYKPELIDDWADAALVASARAAAGQVALLNRLKEAAALPDGGESLLKLWNEASAKLTGIAEAQSYSKLVESWRERTRAASAFLRAFEKSPQRERELAEAWQAVGAAGASHPSLTREHRLRGEAALRWSPILEQLYRMPIVASHENDTKLVNIWGSGAALAGCREAAAFEARVREAVTRLAQVRELEHAIQAAETSGTEDAILAAAAKLQPGYAHPHLGRVREAAEAVHLLASLHKKLAQPFPSDRRVAASFDKLRAINPKLAKRLEHVNPELMAAVEASILRRKLLEEFAQIDVLEPRADVQDANWLELWARHGKELVERRDREELRTRLTLARDRQAAWKKVAGALAAGDIFLLRKQYLENAALLENYPPLVEQLAEIQTLAARAERVVSVQEKLRAGAMLSADDLRFVRENHTAFGPAAKKQIEAQVRARLAGEARLVPAYPAYQLTGSRGGLVKACWAWGGHGLISHCIVAVDGRRFLGDPGEADPFSKLTCRAENHQREGGGITLVPPSGAAQAYVTIWPVIELGWTTILGPPLAIGPVPIGTKVGANASGG